MSGREAAEPTDWAIVIGYAVRAWDCELSALAEPARAEAFRRHAARYRRLSLALVRHMLDGRRMLRGLLGRGH